MPTRHPNPDILLVRPVDLSSSLLDVALPPGYSLRTYQDAVDEEQWIRIHRQAVPSFTEDMLRAWFKRYLTLALPNGIFFVCDHETSRAVATAGCIHQTRDGAIPFGGQLAWVATMPSHQRKGLATAASATATRRLIEMGYENIFVCTGDDLLDAIRIYVRLGFEPYLYEPDMHDRWQIIAEQIGLPFTPERWRKPLQQTSRADDAVP